MVTARGFSELMPFTNTSSGNRIGWYIGRVDNWTGPLGHYCESH